MHSAAKRPCGATLATQLDSCYRYLFACWLRISVYIHLFAYACVCVHACIYSLYAILFYDGRPRINMHMEHTFRVSGLVPGILGSLPSPRGKVQAKLASAVTRQRFIRAPLTSSSFMLNASWSDELGPSPTKGPKALKLGDRCQFFSLAHR